ncbi:OsmC family protein [Rothia sp. ZJ1223]|uniref:OsmC family protein n=1 Tax=Rothia sp. ZJ1223 TaxID=2811098 RepID=UPI00195A8969|nr:OsmC family protein [Rothia sp. ZJ1223]MBM7051132.1 OsmC family protein [Rothia sp. ZJ1223]
MADSNETSPAERTADPNYRSVTVERVGLKHYRARGANGATLDFGQGEGLLTPVELLLAAVAGCSSVDVDIVTSRKAEPENFSVQSSALRVEEEGAVRLDDVEVSFKVTFPATDEGAKAQSMVDRLIKLSAEKDCTVSRTVEHATRVEFINENPTRG